MNNKEMTSSEYALEGVSLIEASAGTGKTYTIETLYLRLLMEKGFTVEQILVVTFTRLATAELQERLRKVLHKLLEALDASEVKDGRLSELLEKWRSMGVPDTGIRKRCETALRDFDRAPIFTIHGFCQRVLQENAFESGVRFGRELLDEGEASEIEEEGFRAFFRRQCYDAKHPLRTWLMTTAIQLPEPVDFQKKLRAVIGDAINDNSIEGFDEDRSEAILEAIESELSNWQSAKETTGYELVKPFLQAMESKAELTKEDKELWESIPEESGKRKELSAMLISYRGTLLQMATRYVTKYLEQTKSSRNFFTYNDLLQELQTRVEESKDLRCVIRKKYPCAIIDEFQDTDPVQNAIFQKVYVKKEEDVEQEEDVGQDNLTFFMIGDPKQAIYAFRGGDLPAYLDASKDVPPEHRHQLKVNYRSSAPFVQAMNALFVGGNFFEHKKLDAAVKASPNAPQVLWKGKEWDFRNWISWFSAESKEKAQEETISTIQKMMALGLEIRQNEKTRPVNYGDFAILVTGGTDLQKVEAKLAKEQIPCSTVGCVSVFSRPQALTLQTFLHGLLECSDQRKAARLMALPFFGWTVEEVDKLRKNGLPHFQIWLGGLLEIWRSRSLLAMFEAFLASTQKDILGEALVELKEDSQKQLLSIAEGIALRPKGNEALVIYRQLAEVLHTKAMEERLGPEGVLKAFEDGLARKNETNGIPEIEQLRLSVEDSAVQVMTIHKSKGLQFSFVFVISLLSSNLKKYPPSFFHRPSNAGSGQNEVSRRIALPDASLFAEEEVDWNDAVEMGRNEAAEEKLRLFYVAVTRARFFVRFLEGKIKDEANSLLNCITGKETAQGLAAGIWPKTTEEQLPKVPGEKFLPETAELSSTATSAASTSASIQAEAADTIGFQLGWRTTSFSSLAPSGKMEGAATLSPERAEDDLEVKADDDQSEGLVAQGTSAPGPLAPVFLLARGEVSGTRWHKLFETLDFQGDGPEWKTEVCRQLQEYALLEDGWHPIRSEDERTTREKVAFEMIQAVLQQRLPRPLPPETRSPVGTSPELLDFSLADIAADQRRAELNFTYWLGRTGKSPALLSGLEGLLTSHHIRMPEDWLRFPTGALTGSIDLLFQGKDGKFYLLDWKTNVIGNDLRNYWPNGLKAEMEKHCYHLQYLIYAAAFFHYYQGLQGADWQLTREEYDRLFGGVFYVFLRGVSKESGTRGFFATRPSFELVKAVYEQLALSQAPKK